MQNGWLNVLSHPPTDDVSPCESPIRSFARVSGLVSRQVSPLSLAWAPVYVTTRCVPLERDAGCHLITWRDSVTSVTPEPSRDISPLFNPHACTDAKTVRQQRETGVCMHVRACMYAVRTHACADGREWTPVAQCRPCLSGCLPAVSLALLVAAASQSVRLSCPSLVQPLLALASHQLY